MKRILGTILILLLVLAPISVLGASTITVGATSYQTFVGWQATAQSGQQYKTVSGATSYEWPSTTYGNYKTDLLNAMLDVGINSLRLEANLADVNATGYDDDSNNAAIQPSTATSGQWHYDRVVSAMDDIVVPYKALLAAQGETLDISLCIVDFKTTGYKAEDTPSEYSFFVKKFVDKIYTTYGIQVNSVEAILEPDNSGGNSNWTPAKVANNIVQTNTDLVAAGYTGIRWKGPSVTSVANAATWYADMKTANASVTPLLFELPYHRYGGTNTDVATFQSAAAADGKTTAMLELIAANADNLYDDLTIGHNSSWQQFTIAFPYQNDPQTDDGGAYFLVSTTSWAVSYGVRTDYLRHFTKYVRAGAVMKSVTNTGTSKGVPFVNSNGTYVVPIKAAGEVITVSGLPDGTYGIRYTTGTVNSTPSAYDQSFSNQTVSGGSDVVFTMPSAGYATVYDVNYMTPPLTCRYFFSTKITGCP